MKKILVAYYSRTGNTKNIGRKIAKILKADIEEIIDKKNRMGIIRWLIAGRDALKKKETEITFKKNPSKYNLLVIGTPVWAATLVPAIRTYLKKNKVKRIAFFCTCGGSPGKTFDELKKISKKPLATLNVRAKELELHEKEIKDFCKKIK
jgi:flavodoxin